MFETLSAREAARPAAAKLAQSPSTKKLVGITETYVLQSQTIGESR